MASVLFLAILSGFHTLSAGCSDEGSSTCISAGCVWNAGSCKATECSLATTCASGCIYQPAVPGYCRDDTGCASIADSVNCSANDKCEMTLGTCDVSEEAKTKCAVPPNSETNCPEGCVKVSAPDCKTQFNPPTCDYDATVSLTTCARRGCTWNGSECVGSYSDCNEYDSTTVSPCSASEFCTVSGSSCVFDSEIFNLCSEIDITEETTECEIWGCQINGSECVNVGEDDVWRNCNQLNTTAVLACSLEASMCVIKDGTCVPGFNELCNSVPGDECLEGEFCKIGGSNQCVYDANACNSLSIEPYTACSNDYSGACKVVTSGGINQCQAKTAEEYCPTLSAHTYPVCESREGCKVEDGKCVKKESTGWDSCDYPIESSQCLESREYNCEVGGTGGCVARVPVCNMNSEGTDCDANNLDKDQCGVVSVYSCVNADCSSVDTEASCTSLDVNAGCGWSATGTCVAKTSCTLTGASTCSSTEDCTLVPESAPSCSRDSSITDATCSVNGNAACDAATGCTWFSAGGSCVEKSCSNSPSYALCCNGTSDDSCAYCAATYRPPDCPCITSYAVCCNGDDSCAYCTAGVRPGDCPCISYAACCNGDDSCAYCTTGARPDDCPCITSYAACCNGDDSCAYCTAGVRPDDCPCRTSYPVCCNDTSDDSCAYCAGTPRPNDCPPTCNTEPSYALCCSGGDSCAYCAPTDPNPRPGDCPPISPDCTVTPDAAGCDTGSTPSSAFNMIAAAALVLAVLFIGWF